MSKELTASGAFSFEALLRLASSMAKSKLFGIQDQDQALSLMLLAQAENKHPATVARDYHVINGKCSKTSEAMLRDFIAGGGKVEWHRLDDAAADATFSHPAGGSVRINWDMDRAKTAGLAGKEMYKKFPRQMLRSRCVSEGCRTVAPSVTGGMYTPEEVQDIPGPVDVTPVPVEQAVTEAHEAVVNAITQDEREEHMLAMRQAATQEDLARAFGAAWTHAGKARDTDARKAFKVAYDALKDEMGTSRPAASEGRP